MMTLPPVEDILFFITICCTTGDQVVEKLVRENKPYYLKDKVQNQKTEIFGNHN